MGVPQMGDRPLFRKEATDFKDQQNLGQIMPLRPIGLYWLVLPLCLFLLIATFLHSIPDEVHHQAVLVNISEGLEVEFAQTDTRRLDGQWQILAQLPDAQLIPVELEYLSTAPCAHFIECSRYRLKAGATLLFQGRSAQSGETPIKIVTIRPFTDQLVAMFSGRT